MMGFLILKIPKKGLGLWNGLVWRVLILNMGLLFYYTCPLYIVFCVATLTTTFLLLVLKSRTTAPKTQMMNPSTIILNTSASCLCSLDSQWRERIISGSQGWMCSSVDRELLRQQMARSMSPLHVPATHDSALSPCNPCTFFWG